MELPLPPSVPLDRLSSLLGKSMAIMKKAEQLKPTRINESANEYQEDEEINEAYTQNTPQVNYAQSVNNSKLPDAIKKLMLDKPITQPNTGVSQSYYNESDEKEMPDRPMRPAQQKTLVREAVAPQTGMITISEAKLEEMINRQLLNFFKTNYDKALTEQAITKTIKTFINEGLLTPKKKI